MRRGGSSATSKNPEAERLGGPGPTEPAAPQLLHAPRRCCAAPVASAALHCPNHPNASQPPTLAWCSGVAEPLALERPPKARRNAPTPMPWLMYTRRAMAAATQAQEKEMQLVRKSRRPCSECSRGVASAHERVPWSELPLPCAPRLVSPAATSSCRQLLFGVDDGCCLLNLVCSPAPLLQLLCCCRNAPDCSCARAAAAPLPQRQQR